MLTSKQVEARSPDRAVAFKPSDGHADAAAAEDESQSMLIVTAVGKGGGGKTTALANLSTVAAKRGWSVGVIDADPQASLSQWRGTRGTSAIKVVPCGEGDDLNGKLESARRAGVKRLFLDTSPSLGEHTLEAIRLADFVVLFTRPASFDVFVSQRRIELLKTMGCDFACVINAAPARRAGIEAPFVRQAREFLRQAGGRPWVGQITHRHSIVQALTDGKGVIEAQPDDPATHEFERLWADIERHASGIKRRRHS
jgi:chromosome partitioning protein